MQGADAKRNLGTGPAKCRGQALSGDLGEALLMMIGTLEKRSDRFFNVRISRLLLEGTMWYNVHVLKMCMLDEIRARRDEIYAIARKHKAEKLWVFGSCARKEERPDSDVDLLVKFGDGASLFDQGAIRSGLSSILGQSVDVVDSDALSREPYFAYAVRKDIVAI